MRIYMFVFVPHVGACMHECICAHKYRVHLSPYLVVAACVYVNLAVPACFDHDACTRAHARVLFMECGIAGPCQLEHIHDNCGQGALYHQKVLVAFWEDVKKSRTALESVLPTFFAVFEEKEVRKEL